jgi:U3 small nucleolar RNA-associated protein 3
LIKYKSSAEASGSGSIKKKKLKSKSKRDKKAGKKSNSDESPADLSMGQALAAENEQKLDEDMEGDDSVDKRGITYAIAKNKGLTPKRKREQRNPRVKHREKFRKATIRRKGQVRVLLILLYV